MDDTLYEGPSTDLTDAQEKALILLQIFSATLSLIGSSVIVCKILKTKECGKKSSSPYDRIILGLSSCDLVSSVTFAASPFMLPRETSSRVWAFGNDGTCTLLGFLIQSFCFWAIWYNCILSFYYLLTVRFQVKRKEFSRKYELWMHLSGLIFFPLTAAIGFVGNFYAEERYNMICWIGEVPKGCYDTGNCWGPIVAYIFGVPAIVITPLAVVINNLVIYVFVRNTFGSVTAASGSHCESSSVGNDFESSPPSTDDMTDEDIENSSSAHERVLKQQRLKKEAAGQGFLYVSCFMLTLFPAFVIQMLEGYTENGDENLAKVYPLLVLNSMFFPLQGFFNVFIYVRPRYTRLKAAEPERSVPWILSQVLFE